MVARASRDRPLVRAEIEAYLKRWISSFGPPLVEGVRATRLRACGGGFEVRITRGTVTAEQVVIATGPSWARSAVVLGPVPDPDLPALVAGADAFAFPSAKEGSGWPRWSRWPRACRRW